jgi:frataxin-like iron-binding protein CyaY
MPILMRYVLFLFFGLAAFSCRSEDLGSRQSAIRFESTNGKRIEIALQAGSLLVVNSQTALHDCSNDTTFCLFDDDGFRFAFFKKCGDWTDDKNAIRFTPLLVRVLDNRSWYVYREAPKYMFEYHWGEGLVGIYFDSKTHYDFRKLLVNETSLARVDRFIFRKVSGDALAACSW